MAATIAQATAINIANEITAAVRAVAGLVPQIEQAVNSYVNNNDGEVLAALTTITLNNDGTYGTDDATPVAGDPIDPTKISGQQTEALSSYNYGIGLNLLQQILALLNGGTVSQVSAAPTILSIFNP